MYQRKVRIQLDNLKPAASENKPFCKICFDAKQSGFDTHYVRDRPGGSVVCPYLLSLECSYCHENGHTVKYCDVLKNKYSTEATKTTTTHAAYIQDTNGWTQRPTQAGKFIVLGLEEPSNIKTKFTESKNKYTSLYEDEVEVPSVYECNFPCLSEQHISQESTQPQLSGWAAVVANKLPTITKSTPIDKKRHIMRWDDECE